MKHSYVVKLQFEQEQNMVTMYHREISYYFNNDIPSTIDEIAEAFLCDEWLSLVINSRGIAIELDKL